MCIQACGKEDSQAATVHLSQLSQLRLHLNNILNQLKASDEDKRLAHEYFKDKTVSYAAVEQYLNSLHP